MTRRKSKAAAAAKSTLAPQARYDAAGMGRRMRGWVPPASGPNRALQGLQTIRNRARDASRNDWSGESGTQKWVTNLVGIGIVPRFPRKVEKALKEALTLLWNDWVKVADADCVLNFYGLMALAVRSWLEAGEVFIRERARPLGFGLGVPLQIQLVEAEFVPIFDADTWPGLPRGNRIKQGIELDRRGQRVAYWMHREHPGEPNSVITSSSNLLRIPADQVSHMFSPTRPGQLRGVSHLAPILARLRSIGDYDDTVLERQKIANLFTLFITRAMEMAGDGDRDPVTNALITDFAKPTISLMPGIVQELLPGEDIKFANPPEAGTTYSDYMRTQHMGTAAGQHLPYEIFSGDIKEVSDRTLRVLINEFRRFAEQRQYHIIIPMFCERVRTWWVNASVLAGEIGVADADTARRVEWSPHGWAHIHPVQDPQGKKLEVDAGFRSRSSVVGERGDDPDAVDEERASDLEREKELDLWVDPNPPPAGAKPGARPDEDGIDNDEYSAPPNAELRDRHLAAQTLLLEAQAFALVRGERAPPQLKSVFDRDPTTGLITGVREVPITEENL